jgi:hypothetical protein
MGKYFDKFPKVYYSLENDGKHPQIVTDVTYSVRLLEKFANDAKYFYTQVIKDGLKPEDVAYLVYGDVQLHWVVLMFNKIVNPLFDWPVASKDFDSVIVAKYGSIDAAQTGIKTYYKVLTTISSTAAETPAVQRIEIGAAEYANVAVDLAGNDIALTNGETVKLLTDRETLSFYDWELQENEAKREIKLIQKTYVDSIKSSFNSLTS